MTHPYALLCVLVLVSVSLTLATVGIFHVVPDPFSHAAGDLINASVKPFNTPSGPAPYSYYSLPLCKLPYTPSRKIDLGSAIGGSRSLPSGYSFHVGKNVRCQLLCSSTFHPRHITRAQTLIRAGYYGHMEVDGLPVISHSFVDDQVPQLGYSIGGMSNASGNTLYWYRNHIHFSMKYTPLRHNRFRITGVSVASRSIAYTDLHKECTEDSIETVTPLLYLTNQSSEMQTIPITYGVSWGLDDSAKVMTRWDVLRETSSMRHSRPYRWLVAMTAVIPLLLFCLAFAAVMLGTVRRDLSRFAGDEFADELRYEKGWRLLGGDVFRPPAHPLVFSALVGSGCQLLAVASATFAAMAMGMWEPSRRGGLLNGLVFLFLISNTLSGYVSARMLKFFKCQSWQNGFLAFMLVPSGFLCLYLFLNFIQQVNDSSSAIPFTTALTFLGVRLLLIVPLGFIGVWAGFRQNVAFVPSKSSSIPRLLPPISKSFYCGLAFAGSVIPFVAYYSELSFIWTSLWEGDIFTSVTLSVVVCCAVTVLCMELSVGITYLTLNRQDYRWWWRSWLSLAASGVPLFIYGLKCFWYSVQLSSFSALLLFVGYMLFLSILHGLLLGAVSFMTSFWFVHAIYSTKVE